MDVVVVAGEKMVYTLTFTRLLQNCRLGLLRKEEIVPSTSLRMVSLSNHCSFFLFDGKVLSRNRLGNY